MHLLGASDHCMCCNVLQCAAVCCVPAKSNQDKTNNHDGQTTHFLCKRLQHVASDIDKNTGVGNTFIFMHVYIYIYTSIYIYILLHSKLNHLDDFSHRHSFRAT